jgi:hypothetical protein
MRERIGWLGRGRRDTIERGGDTVERVGHRGSLTDQIERA